MGDFRTKKLIEPFRTAGAKVAVFGQVADQIEQLVQSDEQNVARHLLKLSTLINAILYTQGKSGADGDMEALEAKGIEDKARLKASVAFPVKAMFSADVFNNFARDL